MDALLGACALEISGTCSPDSDPAYAGRAACGAAGRVVSASNQGIPGQAMWMPPCWLSPKTAPYLEQMRRNLAWRLRVPVKGRCQRQATTEEGPWLYRHGRRHCRPCRGEPSVTGEPDAPRCIHTALRGAFLYSLLSRLSAVP